MIVQNHTARIEHQLMEFEDAVSVLIYIHLQCRVKGMYSELIMVRESKNIVTQPLVVIINHIGILGTFV